MKLELTTWLTAPQQAALEMLLAEHNDHMAQLGEQPITVEEFVIGSIPRWIEQERKQVVKQMTWLDSEG
jgi:hypothetical protein